MSEPHTRARTHTPGCQFFGNSKVPTWSATADKFEHSDLFWSAQYLPAPAVTQRMSQKGLFPECHAATRSERAPPTQCRKLPCGQRPHRPLYAGCTVSCQKQRKDQHLDQAHGPEPHRLIIPQRAAINYRACNSLTQPGICRAEAPVHLGLLTTQSPARV